MQPLYHRLLETLFPDEMKHSDINPAAMFISSLSTKEFFSVLSRKVVEYYKLNSFDIEIDSFEAKVGLGSSQGIASKHINNYYGYLIASQLNGKKFYNPTHVCLHIAMLAGSTWMDLLDADELPLAMLAAYIMPLLFVSHLKKLPDDSAKDQYNRFVQLYRSCIELVADIEEYDGTLDVDSIVTAISLQAKSMQSLFVVCQHAGAILPTPKNHKEYRTWLMSGDVQDNFVSNYEQTRTTHALSEHELVVLTTLLPYDFLIRHVYVDIPVKDVMRMIISPRYPDHLIQQWYGLSEGGAADRPVVLQQLIDTHHIKNSLRSSVQSFITHHRSQHSDSDDVEEFLSSIHEGMVDPNTIPDSIKHESHHVNQLVHFYVGITGGSYTSKAQTMWHGWTVGINHFIDQISDRDEQRHTRDYRSHISSMYNTNGFFYHHAWDHIRDGKQKFHIPLQAGSHDAGFGDYTYRYYVANALSRLTYDLLPRPQSLTVQQSGIVELFKIQYYGQLQKALEEDTLAHHWGALSVWTGIKCDSLWDPLFNDDVKMSLVTLNKSLYTLDHRLFLSCIRQLNNDIVWFEQYSADIRISIAANLKHSLMGMMIWMRYVHHHHPLTRGDSHSNLINIYITRVLGINEHLVHQLTHIVQGLYLDNKELLTQWIQLDDNPMFLELCTQSWIAYIKKHPTPLTSVSGEDVLWFHSVLHHIHQYNIRYIFPIAH